MEKELEELWAFFEDKKHIFNLLAILNSKYSMNDDILTIIYNNISVGDIGDKYEYLTQKEESGVLILAE
jgi:hypothetical protein